MQRAPLWLVPIVAASLAAGAGCRRTSDENLGLGKTQDWKVDVAALARPGELEKALALPSTEVARLVGPYRLDASTRLSLASGDTHESLDESFHLEVDAASASRVVRETSHGGGNEAIAAGGSYYVRPRYGRFVRRNPEGDEVERGRDDVQGLAAGYLGILGRFATRSDGPPADRAGRRAIPIKLALAAHPTSFDDPDPAHAWRATLAVTTLDGEVWLDAKTAAPLEIRLDARYTAKRGERAIAVELNFRSKIEAGGPVAAIAPPTDAVASPQRARPLVDRQTLLDGLAKVKRAPATREPE